MKRASILLVVLLAAVAPYLTPALALGFTTGHLAVDERGTVGTSLPEAGLGSTEHYDVHPVWTPASTPEESPMLPSGYALPSEGFDSVVSGHEGALPAQQSYLTVAVPGSSDASAGARVYACIYYRERVPSDGNVSGDCLMSDGTGDARGVVNYTVGGVNQGGIVLAAPYPTKDGAFHTMPWESSYGHGEGFGGQASWGITDFAPSITPTFLSSPNVYSEDDTWGWRGESVMYVVLDEVFPNMIGSAYQGTWTHRVIIGYGRNDRTPGILTASEQVCLVKEQTASSADATTAPSWPGATVSWSDEPASPALVHAQGGTGGGWNAAQCWFDIPHLTGYSGSWPTFATPDATSVASWTSVTLPQTTATWEYTGAFGAGEFVGADAVAVIDSSPETAGLGGISTGGGWTAPAPSVPTSAPAPSTPATMPSLDASGAPSMSGLTDALNGIGLGWLAAIPGQLMAGVQNLFGPLQGLLWLWQKVGGW